jgi:hypothetical protein
MCALSHKADIWTVAEHNERRNGTAEMRFLKSVANQTRSQAINNTKVKIKLPCA